MIGIIGAMEEEVSVILSEVSNVEAEEFGGFLFYKAKYNNKDLVIVKCGIGMVNAAIVTTILKTRFSVEKILFSGVAGAIADNISVGDIVIGDSFVEYDFDVTSSNKYVKGQRPGTDKRDIDADLCMVEKTKEVDFSVPIHYGRIASADKFISDYDKKIELQKEFDAIAVDMESAAVAHACETFKIPFLIIRSISDSITDSFMEYDEFVYHASKNSKEFLFKFIGRI